MSVMVCCACSACGSLCRYALPLAQKQRLNHDTFFMRFVLPSPQHQLGLPCGKHVFLCAGATCINHDHVHFEVRHMQLQGSRSGRIISNTAPHNCFGRFQGGNEPTSILPGIDFNARV